MVEKGRWWGRLWAILVFDLIFKKHLSISSARIHIVKKGGGVVRDLHIDFIFSKIFVIFKGTLNIMEYTNQCSCTLNKLNVYTSYVEFYLFSFVYMFLFLVSFDNSVLLHKDILNSIYYIISKILFFSHCLLQNIITIHTLSLAGAWNI